MKLNKKNINKYAEQQLPLESFRKNKVFNAGVISLSDLQSIGQLQINRLLKNYDKNNYSQRLIIVLIEQFWKYVEYVYWLNKRVWYFFRRKYRIFSALPVRSSLEILCKVTYFVNSDESKRNIIAQKEILNLLKTFYDISKVAEDTKKVEYYITQYNKFAKGEFEQVDQVNIKDLKAFPPFTEIMNSTQSLMGLSNSYDLLSKDAHTNWLYQLLFGKKTQDLGRRSVFLLLRYCYEMLKIADHYLDNETLDIVNASIEKSIGSIIEISE